MAADFRINNLIAQGASFIQRPTVNSSGVLLIGDATTGSFLTTGAGDLRYAATGATGSFLTTGVGDTRYAFSSATGSFLTTGVGDLRYVEFIDQPVYQTGDQTINGIKTFNTGIFVQYVEIGNGPGNSSPWTNTAIGYFAFRDNVGGYYNTAIGGEALRRNINGHDNTAIGYKSLTYNTVGNFNVAIGAFALHSGVSGDNNLAIGTEALYSNSLGSNNISYGYQSLRDNTIGIGNLANGVGALRYNTSGSYNIAQGTSSLFNNISGSNNVSIGVNAGRYITGSPFGINTNPNNSIYIGYESKANADNETNQTVIGYQAQGIGSNTTTIGNSNITETKLAGAITTYGTYTNSTNYERLSLKYNGSNIYQIGTEQGAAGGLPRSLDFITSGVSRMQINSGGNISATALILTSGLAITGIAPATTGAPGVSGQMVFASNFIYRHNGTNWQRTGIGFANWP